MTGLAGQGGFFLLPVFSGTEADKQGKPTAAAAELINFRAGLQEWKKHPEKPRIEPCHFSFCSSSS